MLSDIQVFVRWKEQTIFAGEDVECTITFKNVTEEEAGNEVVGTTKHYRGGSRPINTVTDGTNYSPAKSLNPFSFNNPQRRPQSSGYRPRQPLHRSSASVGSSPILSQSFPPTTASRTNGTTNPRGHSHKRSVSIISLETDISHDRKPLSSPQSPRPTGRHTRSASFQAPPRRYDLYKDDSQPVSPRTPMSRFSPITSQSNLALPNTKDGSDSSRYAANNSPTARKSPIRRPPHKRSPFHGDFKFPQAPPSPESKTNQLPQPCTEGQPAETPTKSTIPEHINTTVANGKLAVDQPRCLTPATKLSAVSAIEGSTRSSTEFYSLSNNSTETLDSDYKLVSMNRGAPRHRRHQSSLEPSRNGRAADSQTLLMGYAQINASFTVDGSLLDQSIFEEVKRKGVVGHHGNSERSPRQSKNRSGFWGNIGLTSLGNSLASLTSTGELDGLREMRGASSSHSIPLLSTPQSLLFVDLRLAPGQEKAFSFSFTLPRGLPSSHKGKAIKISYNLVIGTQKATAIKGNQRLHKINVPFRVLSGVDAQGGVLGHDLMQPYVVLRDEARVQSIDSAAHRLPTKETSISAKAWTSAPQFLSYVDEILKQRDRPDSLMSPVTPGPPHLHHDAPFSCKDAIDLAILRSNQSTASDQSANRFEISRSGRRVAVIVLNRPSHRIGETIVATADFTNAAIHCHSLRSSLETHEKINPEIALRSPASIIRATRKVHAMCFENTLFASRVAFTPAIPVSATPTLITSGVSVEWQLRFEFVTSSVSDVTENVRASGVGLLEPVERDERGTIFAAAEHISCESFEVSIPITVYGGTVQEPSREDLQGIPI
ncbi:Golgi membrane exchange factor (Ric1p-Rgp1p) subunit [Microsporum audouinii]